MATGTVRVRGLKELARAFKGISKDLSKELVQELRQAADPVKKEAEQLALTRIRNMPRTPEWAGMRIAVAKSRGTVTMYPQRRRRGGSARPNLATLLMDEAMDPGLEHNQQKVINRIDGLLGRLGGEHGF